MPCIEAHNLRKTFGKTIALAGIDLRVEEGGILGIGGNPAGKTTPRGSDQPYQAKMRPPLSVMRGSSAPLASCCSRATWKSPTFVASNQLQPLSAADFF